MDAIKQLPKLKPIYTTGTMQSCNLQENTTDARFMVYAVIVLLPNGMGITLWLCYIQVFMEELTKMSRTVVIGEYWHVITWNT